MTFKKFLKKCSYLKHEIFFWVAYSYIGFILHQSIWQLSAEDVISICNLSVQSLWDDQSISLPSLIKYIASVIPRGKEALRLHWSENELCRTTATPSVIMINVFYDCCSGHKFLAVSLKILWGEHTGTSHGFILFIYWQGERNLRRFWHRFAWNKM